MTYRLIASTETDPDSPVTSTLMIALDQNLAATAAGETDAPKIALKSDAAALGSGNTDFSGLGAWSGVWFTIGVRNSNAVTTRTVSFDLSDDGGSTVLGAVVLASIPPNAGGTISGFCDFATGLVIGVSASANSITVGSAGVINQTVAGSSLAVDYVRFIGDTNLAGGVMIHPNGGESAT